MLWFESIKVLYRTKNATLTLKVYYIFPVVFRTIPQRCFIFFYFLVFLFFFWSSSCRWALIDSTRISQSSNDTTLRTKSRSLVPNDAQFTLKFARCAYSLGIYVWRFLLPVSFSSFKSINTTLLVSISIFLSSNIFNKHVSFKASL